MNKSYRKRPDELANLLKNRDCDRRQSVWLWLKVAADHRFQGLDVRTCASSSMRDEIARTAAGRKFALSGIWNQRDCSLIPDAELKWIDGDERQCQWLLRRLEDICHPRLPRGLTHLIERERLVAMIDYWEIDLAEKARQVADLRREWLRHKARDTAFEWFKDKKDGAKRCICAQEWLDKYHLSLLASRQPITNHKELIMFFDQAELGRHEQKAVIQEIKRRWNRKQFDERTADKKQVNVLLTKMVIAQLDELAKRYDLKRAQVLETLVGMEAERGEYLTRPKESRYKETLKPGTKPGMPNRETQAGSYNPWGGYQYPHLTSK